MQEGPSGTDILRLAQGEPQAIDQAEGMLAPFLEKNPQLAELLLPLLKSGRETLVINARRLLCLFGDDAILSIARGFDIDDATARFQILGVLWAHLIPKPPHELEEWVEEVAPHLLPGLDDLRKPRRYFADPERLELEHDYRVCDETYLFINRLLDPDFDDSSFEIRDDEARAAIARQFSRRSANLFMSPAAAAKKAARKPAALAEITIIGRFPNAYATADTQQERDQAKIAKWAPTQRDFKAVANVDTPQPAKAIIEVTDFLEMIGAILFVDPSKPDKSKMRPKQSIKRINIISHGNPGLIAMAGSVDQQGTVLLQIRGPDDGALRGPIDLTSLEAAADPTVMIGGKAIALSLRDRMAPDAEIYLLACHTGMGGSIELIKAMKELFHSTIHAFTEEIAYCPTIDDTHILDRAFTAVKDCNSGSTRGFKHLQPDVTK